MFLSLGEVQVEEGGGSTLPPTSSPLKRIPGGSVWGVWASRKLRTSQQVFSWARVPPLLQLHQSVLASLAEEEGGGWSLRTPCPSFFLIWFRSEGP